MILYITLHREIGLKSLSSFGFSTLGIITIVVSLIPAGILLVWKKICTPQIISSFTIPQFRWKKPGWKAIRARRLQGSNIEKCIIYFLSSQLRSPCTSYYLSHLKSEAVLSPAVHPGTHSGQQRTDARKNGGHLSHYLCICYHVTIFIPKLINFVFLPPACCLTMKETSISITFLKPCNSRSLQPHHLPTV
jgi:hypothetical protein